MNKQQIELNLKNPNWYPENDDEAIALFRYMEKCFWERTRFERDGKEDTSEYEELSEKQLIAYSRFAENIDKGKYIVFPVEGTNSLIEALYKFRAPKTGENIIPIDSDEQKYRVGGSMFEFKDEIARQTIPDFLKDYLEADDPDFEAMDRQALLAYMKEHSYPIDYLKLTDEELAEAVKTCYYAEFGNLALGVKGVRYDGDELDEDDDDGEGEEEIDLEDMTREQLIAFIIDEDLDVPYEDLDDDELREAIDDELDPWDGD